MALLWRTEEDVRRATHEQRAGVEATGTGRRGGYTASPARSSSPRGQPYSTLSMDTATANKVNSTTSRLTLCLYHFPIHLKEPLAVVEPTLNEGSVNPAIWHGKNLIILVMYLC